MKSEEEIEKLKKDNYNLDKENQKLFEDNIRLENENKNLKSYLSERGLISDYIKTRRGGNKKCII